MEKVCIIQCNIGNFDTVAVVPEQSCPYDYFLFTENNLPYPLPDLSNRVKSRFIKFQMHKFLQGYDAYIYLDGRIEVTSEHFVIDMIGKLSSADIVITKHPDRNTVKEEIEFILHWLSHPESKAGGYLLSRYRKEDIELQKTLINENLPLYACGVFAWRPGFLNYFFDLWFEMTLRYGFDQCLFSHVFKGRNICQIGYDLVKVNNHK